MAINLMLERSWGPSLSRASDNVLPSRLWTLDLVSKRRIGSTIPFFVVFSMDVFASLTAFINRDLFACFDGGTVGLQM